MPSTQFPPATPEQTAAWGYYGTPNAPLKPGSKAAASSAHKTVSPRVGEVRYIVGWMADQMVRMGWRITVDGSESWVVKTSDGSTVTSDAEESDTEAPSHPANASRRLLQVIEWDSRTVREVTTNLFVAGELHYAMDGGHWRVVSVVRPDRNEILNRSSMVIRGIWPHPADPNAPDAPLFGVLDVLDDMTWLNRLSRSQSANRVGMRGIVGVADGWATANGSRNEDFWNDFESSLSRPMDDPEDISPVGLIGAAELVKPEGSGMSGLAWIVPEFPYDDKVDERMEKLVQRLAYGLPVPPEILLGLQAQSKATAFQVEGATYRAHIEPAALLVARIATDALKILIPEIDSEVIPDPTAILARRHSVSDVLEAFDRGAVSFDYVREVLGIPKRAAPTEEDLRIRAQVLGRQRPLESPSDPANDAASEPISAAASLPQEETQQAPHQPTIADEWLAETLHRIDAATFHSLMGAAEQAVTKARERLGARLRADRKLKSQIPQDLTNEEITLKLGESTFAELGIDHADIVNDALASTATWWKNRATKARSDTELTLQRGKVGIEFSPSAIEESTSLLLEELHAATFRESGLIESRIRDIVTLAGS